MARRLTAAQIDDVVAALRSKHDHDFISRGRGGSGFGHRDGQLYRVRVEEDEREERAVSEDELRQVLAGLDLDDYIQRYDVWSIQQMGVAIEGPGFPAR
jgi:hypothetical protein